MLIDGEKYACEACVRGHRVSSCHHSDRQLTHINKKGRPVSQCAHCRGLRKSRTTHTQCDCGDKKKKEDCHTGVAHGRCGCCHGQRCTCALKKEHLDTVPETGLPFSPPPLTIETPRKPLLRLPNLNRRSRFSATVIINPPTSIMTWPTNVDCLTRSHDRIPSTTQPTYLVGQSSFIKEPLTLSEFSTSQQTSQNGSPNSAHVSGAEDDYKPAPPDHLYIDNFATPAPPAPSIDRSHDVLSNPTSAPTTMDKFPLEQIVTSVPPLDISSFASFPTTSTNSPITCMPFQEPYQECYFTSPDSDMPLGSAGIGAPSVDWSSFPLYSDVPAANSTQAPSYASFDYNGYPSGLPPPSSSGDISEADEFGPLPGLGHASNDMHDLHSVSEASDMEQLRVSSASSLVGLPQARLLSSNDLDSINIDDFLNSTNESTAALEHQLQASMSMEPKSVPAHDIYTMSQIPLYKPMTSAPITSAPSPDSVPIWPGNLFDAGSTPPIDDNFFQQTWAQ
ncbi:Copper fist DNA-binding [Penicillium cf. griseofulvum]|nr:Copper fist DNA-binding [Penicillium cf. griseofulvum]